MERMLLLFTKLSVCNFAMFHLCEIIKIHDSEGHVCLCYEFRYCSSQDLETSDYVG